jgi:hypothetical protein
MKRLNLRDRECPKCGGKIGMIRRGGMPKDVLCELPLYGCVGNTHVQVSGTYGYSPNDFPKKVKPPTAKEINKFIGSIRREEVAEAEEKKI